MKTHNITYNVINIAAILVTACLFVFEYGRKTKLFNDYTVASFLILVIAVILVHTIKAARLYLALYGNGIEVKEFVKTYCKVIPVSVILPFKTGELFRIYCYGHLIGNMLKGLVIILFDRFMDTAALLTIVFLAWILNGGKPETIVYFLIIFLVFILIVYFMYPGIKTFWTKYLLKSKATERKLGALKTMEKLNMIYYEIANVAKGRGTIIYCLSLLAWGVEIGSLYVLGMLGSGNCTNQDIYEYLNAALGGNESDALKRFILATVFLLILVYIALKIKNLVSTKRNEE